MARGEGGWRTALANGSVDSPTDFMDNETHLRASPNGTTTTTTTTNASLSRDLASMDASLRCPICGDVFRAPMMLASCGHTFCSLCIRRALMTGRGECPSCRMGGGSSARRVTDADLRRNGVVAEIVTVWEDVRRGVLDSAKRLRDLEKAAAREQEELNAKVPTRKRRPADENEDSPERQRGVRASARSRNKVDYNDAAAFDGNSDDNDLEQSRMPTEDHSALDKAAEVEPAQDPNDPDAKVTCPICQGPIKLSLAFQHTATCTGEPRIPERAEPTRPDTTVVQRSNSRDTTKEVSEDDASLQRLHLPNYNLLKVTQLRDLLKKSNILAEIGSKSQAVGRSEKSILEKRHRRWITLWNANCDEAPARRRSFRDLKRELVEWEIREDQDEPQGPSSRDIEDRESDRQHRVSPHQH